MARSFSTSKTPTLVQSVEINVRERENHVVLAGSLNTVTRRSRNLGSPRAASSTISGFDFVPSPYVPVRATSGSLRFPKLHLNHSAGRS